MPLVTWDDSGATSDFIRHQPWRADSIPLHLASARCALNEKSVMESFSPKNPQHHSFKKARIVENE